MHQSSEIADRCAVGTVVFKALKERLLAPVALAIYFSHIQVEHMFAYPAIFEGKKGNMQCELKAVSTQRCGQCALDDEVVDHRGHRADEASQGCSCGVRLLLAFLLPAEPQSLRSTILSYPVHTS